ncbi:MAG: polyphosphate kinase [Bacteroidetes bacterium 46-16]|nr:MAG: polyphosphate kinase [Bacteroidetes bacterium 46-16]
MAKIKLKEISTVPPSSVRKGVYKAKLVKILDELNELQNLLYAENKHAVLIIIQGMDASGKDGLTRDVFTSMNPQGVNVKPFKEPTDEELAHDFLWRIHQHTPAKGMIHIFNRSHYEDILVTRVHKLIDDKTAQKRMEAINDFERLLVTHNNTHILKFYLHISHAEQRSRLEERMEKPQKMWKYNAEDIVESAQWDEYRKCYEEAMENCSEVSWQIIPADKNWYKSYLVARALRDLLVSLNMKYPGLKRGKK